MLRTNIVKQNFPSRSPSRIFGQTVWAEPHVLRVPNSAFLLLQMVNPFDMFMKIGIKRLGGK
jgi:hypothetical protein